MFGDLVNGGRVTIGIENDELTFSITELPKVLSKEEKKALKRANAEKAAEELVDELSENQDNQ